MRKLITIFFLGSILFAFSCKNQELDKEKLKQEVMEELKEEMNNEKTEITDNNSEEKKDENVTIKKRDYPQTVGLNTDMLLNLTLVGEKNVYRFKQDYIEIASLDNGSAVGKISYEADKSLKEVFTKTSDFSIKINIHQDYAIGGDIKIDQVQGAQGDYGYFFNINWETESGDSGYGFHKDEEYEILGKVQSTAFGTGGSFFTFSYGSGETIDFYYYDKGVDLMKTFTGLEPMSDKNPYKDKQYKIFYKYMEIEGYKYYRVEPVVTYIEEK